MSLLAPGQVNKQTFDSAFFQLKKASQYKDDANLCNTLSDAIYSAQSNFAVIESLRLQNESLKRLVSQAEWNKIMSTQTSSLIRPSGKETSLQAQAAKDERDARMASANRALSEAGQTIQNNNLRMGAWESVEVAAKNFPDDNKLNQARANLTTKTSDFGFFWEIDGKKNWKGACLRVDRGDERHEFLRADSGFERAMEGSRR